MIDSASSNAPISFVSPFSISYAQSATFPERSPVFLSTDISPRMKNIVFPDGTHCSAS